MRRLVNYFLRGLIFVAPIAVTVWICWKIFVTIDGLLHLGVPGAGFLLTLALITLVGFLVSSLLSRSIVGVVESLLERLPFVRLLYSSTRDLLKAFVGEQRRFDKPVLVTLLPGSGIRAFGFVTQQSLDALGIAGSVAVYMPQSYNFAGQLVVVPAAQVAPLGADSSDVMAFIVSGGVTGLPRAAAAA